MVSVLVVTYQHAPFIAECIQGILMQQTTFPVEILIGEDGSTDGTREICQRLATAHPERIRLFLNDRKKVICINGKPTGRWNMLNLLAQSRGRYIALCEGDDLWTDPEKLAKQVAVLERNENSSGTYHATRMIQRDGAPTGYLMREHLPERMTLLETMAPVSPFHTSSFLFRSTSLPRSLPAWSKKVTSFDMALFTLVAGEGTLLKVEGVMSSYRKHPGGVTTRAYYNGTRFHQQRILLWLYMDEHFGHRYTKRCMELFLEHWRHIIQQSTPRVRLSYLARLIREAPGWFIRKPRFLAQRIRESLNR